MSLKSKIEAVIYASEEPVTLAQLAVVLGGEAQTELEALAARQSELSLGTETQPDGEAPTVADTPVPEETSGDLDGTELAESVEPETQPQDATEDNLPDMAVPADTEAAGDKPQVDPEVEKRLARERDRAIRDHLRRAVDELMRDYAESDRGIEVREVAGGFRMGTKPEYHDAVRGFVRSLKPALKLSLQALETLAVVAYKQPVTAAEISEIRGVDSAGVLGGLLTRKLIQTAGRKQVIGRPMLYKTTKEFLVRFGLKDIHELPSMEEFERMAGELNEQEDLPMEGTDAVIERANARGDAELIREVNKGAAISAESEEAVVSSPKAESQPAVDKAPTEDDAQPVTQEASAEQANEERKPVDLPKEEVRS